jgi:hypothetical protein
MITEDCPVFANDEFPMALARISNVGTVLLGNMDLRNLAPKQQRLVYVQAHWHGGGSGF